MAKDKSSGCFGLALVPQTELARRSARQAGGVWPKPRHYRVSVLRVLLLAVGIVNRNMGIACLER